MILLPWVLVSLPSPPLHPSGRGLVTVLLCLPWVLHCPSWSHRPGLCLCREIYLGTLTGVPPISGGGGAEGYRKGLGLGVWPSQAQMERRTLTVPQSSP